MRENTNLCAVIIVLNTVMFWSSLEQGKKLQHFLLDRVAKFISLFFEQGQGFIESAETPYPNYYLGREEQSHHRENTSN